ncbi:MAG: alpha/beta-type small acid-soluble spore protein [Lachnospiraceae bacterium]|nr:alpha/beta-type small acid-soluble spore protein [Lachnospiraceae bacterium]
MDFEKLEPNDRMKYEIAEELGLLEKVREGGWKALSARETGRIGGILSRRKKALETDAASSK